jgi:hypothetical protein
MKFVSIIQNSLITCSKKVDYADHAGKASAFFNQPNCLLPEYRTASVWHFVRFRCPRTNSKLPCFYEFLISGSYSTKQERTEKKKQTGHEIFIPPELPIQRKLLILQRYMAARGQHGMMAS